MEKSVERAIPIEILTERQLFNGKWMNANEITFTIPGTKITKVWQCAHRSTKPAEMPVDGVEIIPILKRTGKEPEIILIKQFRVPPMAWCVEFPAGLVDPKETLERCAERELFEETGYKMRRILHSTKGIQPLDPGLSSSSVILSIVEIDGDLAENQNPKPSFDDGEIIEVFTVPLKELVNKLAELSQEGLQVEATLYSFALGLNFNAYLNV